MCSVNPIMYQNQIDKLPQIQQDYEGVKGRVDKGNKLPSIFDVIPTFRRIERVPDKIEHSDFVPAAGLVSLAVLNAPEDLRDMKSAYSQIKASVLGNFRGTLLHKFVNPKTSPCPKLAKWLLKNDTTLMSTKLGDYVVKKFDIERTQINTKIENITSTKEKPSFVVAKKFVTHSPFGELTVRAMTRTTKIGAIALGSLEMAHLIKEISDGENAIKSTAKSAINLTSSIAGIGYGGAIGAKYFGPLGSLIGMGIGAIAGNQVAKFVD